jgi:alanine dehydrogenase
MVGGVSRPGRPSPLVLTDADVRAALTPSVAVDACRRAVVDAYRGALRAPPRLRAELGALDIVLTAGGYEGGIAGFRAYGTWPGDSDQAVLVWDAHGRLRGVVTGAELGARRTGALGAVAAEALARPDAAAVGVVGSGRQAWSQLWALTAVRSPARVLVFSPTAAHRKAFAERARAELGLDAAPAGSAEEAVAAADILVVATRAEAPVLDPGWVQRGAHVATVGPKLRGTHELPAELVERAEVAVSDSPDQAAAYPGEFFTARRLDHLGAVVCGDLPGRRSDAGITVYCSTGLAGTEVAVADALFAAPR